MHRFPLFLLLLLLAACSSPADEAVTPTPTAAPTTPVATSTLPPTAAAIVTPSQIPAPTRSATPTPPASPMVASATASTATYPAMPAGLTAALVVGVIDGDTVDVALEGQLYRLRLIGLDTPETVDPRKPVQCFGREASARAHALLDGQRVLLEADPTQGEWDKYDRLLRYVWLEDGRLFNLEMIREGYAHEYTYNVPYRYQDIFREAQRAAREQGMGLWAATTCAGDTDQAAAPGGQPASQPVPPTQPSASGPCDPSYPDVCIPPAPPDLDCGQISFRRFRVVGADPHRFDGDGDGVGCEG